MFLLPLVPLPFWYIDMDVPFLFPSLPLATSASTAVILSKTHRGGERWEIERPLPQMTSVLYWSKARDTHNSTFVLWSTHAPMSSHSLLIVCVRVWGGYQSAQQSCCTSTPKSSILVTERSLIFFFFFYFRFILSELSWIWIYSFKAWIGLLFSY